MQRRWKTKDLVARVTLLTVMIGLFGNVLFAGGAHADYAPSTYNSATGKGDVVCVGSDTLQFLGDFMADGDPNGRTGANASKQFGKMISLDATGDANARFSYSQTQTFGVAVTPSALDPTAWLRAGNFPAQRPNGSGAGYRALLADVTSTTSPNVKINCVRGSSLPTSAQFTQAHNQGWGGLHVVRAATETLAVAAVSSGSCVPQGLSAAQLVALYQDPGVASWSALPGGYNGSCAGTSTPHPLLPQPGSGTRNTFLADLKAANGNVDVVLCSCVNQGVEENDPASLTNDPSPADAFVPFSGGRLNLWNGKTGTGLNDAFGNFFHNPHAAFGVPYPGGAALTAGVGLVTGTTSDAAAPYTDVRGLFFTWRAVDDNLTGPWQGAGPNWVSTLFTGSTSTLRGIAGQGLVNDSGATWAFKDCGVDNVNGC